MSSSVAIDVDLRSQLTELAKLNHNMLKNAEAGNWDKVIEAEKVRRSMLDTLYSSPGVENIPGVDTATREMVSINQRLEELAISAHKLVTTEVVSINKGQQAISTYEKYVR